MRALGIALAFLTRLPTWDPGVLPPEALGPPSRWFPIVGLLVGGLAAAVFGTASLVLPVPLAALIAVGAGVLTTGALHEDGLADLADAAGVRGDAERRRAAMKDPSLGAFGVLVLIFSVTLRAGALATVGPALGAGWLVLAHAVSRGAMVFPLKVASAQGSGLQAAVSGAMRPVDVVVASLSAVGIAVAWLGVWALGPLVVAGLACAVPVVWARRRLGGVSGDVLGAGQQLAELAILLLGAALVTTGSHPDVPWWR